MCIRDSLYIARGSSGEVRSMLSIVEQMSEFAHLKSEISNFKSQAESVSRQLAAWARSLQNSDIEGHRHLNDQSKANYDCRKRRAAFELEQQKWRTEFEAKLNAEVAARQDA